MTIAVSTTHAARIRAAGNYIATRELPDGTIVGLGRLLFTTAVYVDMNDHGWARRYCYESAAAARLA